MVRGSGCSWTHERWRIVPQQCSGCGTLIKIDNGAFGKTTKSENPTYAAETEFYSIRPSREGNARIKPCRCSGTAAYDCSCIVRVVDSIETEFYSIRPSREGIARIKPCRCSGNPGDGQRAAAVSFSSLSATISSTRSPPTLWKAGMASLLWAVRALSRAGVQGTPGHGGRAAAVSFS